MQSSRWTSASGTQLDASGKSGALLHWAARPTSTRHRIQAGGLRACTHKSMRLGSRAFDVCYAPDSGAKPDIAVGSSRANRRHCEDRAAQSLPVLLALSEMLAEKRNHLSMKVLMKIATVETRRI